jgi:hypothetical protein
MLKIVIWVGFMESGRRLRPSSCERSTAGNRIRFRGKIYAHFRKIYTVLAVVTSLGRRSSFLSARHRDQNPFLPLYTVRGDPADTAGIFFAGVRARVPEGAFISNSEGDLPCITNLFQLHCPH